MNPLLYLWIFLKASLFSTGGFGNLPSLHTDLLARHWATERQFAESLMIGQISPGPNGLWVICLGYLTHGLQGAFFALIAVSLPPLSVLLVDRLYQRVKDHVAVEGFVSGLSLSVVGIFGIILVSLLHSIGMNPHSLLIALGAFGLASTRRVPIPAIIAIAALVGILWR